MPSEAQTGEYSKKASYRRKPGAIAIQHAGLSDLSHRQRKVLINIFADMKKATVHDKMNSGHVVHFQGLEPWAR